MAEARKREGLTPTACEKMRVKYAGSAKPEAKGGGTDETQVLSSLRAITSAFSVPLRSEA